MTDAPNTYERAIEMLGDLAETPLQEAFQGPLPLARSIGLPATSGYRAVAQAEAVGLLTRDAEGVYRRGINACQIGLSAMGFGAYASAAEPVLGRLRQRARMTAFLGVIRDTVLVTGPFSQGRGSVFLEPTPLSDLPVAPLWAGDAPVAIGLLPRDGNGRRVNALLARVAEGRDGAVAVVGVLLPVHPGEIEKDLAEHVQTARDRFLQSATPS